METLYNVGLLQHIILHVSRDGYIQRLKILVVIRQFR